ncbi:MAG: glycoside hydrolase family 16 protein [Tannerella sp.]|jgi:hypothetical protein|nr:glycoside hydrolase family 16 protein [Tannerella sp.]
MKRFALWLCLAGTSGGSFAQNTLTLADFEDEASCFTHASAGLSPTIVSNPHPESANSSSKVLKLETAAFASAQAIARDSSRAESGPKSFVVGEGPGQYRYAHFKVWKNFPSQIQWQFRNANGNGVGYVNYSGSETDKWEHVVIDFLTTDVGHYNAGDTFYGFHIFMDYGKSQALTGFSAYIDDIYLSDSPDRPDDTPVVDGWKLLFEDHFDGTAVNTANWSMYNGAGHVNNGLRRPEAFTVEDGLLVVTAQMKDGELVSGGMACRENFLYGRFEFRVRADADPSLATNAVVLTWPQNENWPVDGELDIYETTLIASRTPFYTFIHYGINNQTANYAHQADGKEWHTMMCEWTPDRLTVYRDGTEAWSTTLAAAIPHVAHHLCIQLDAFSQTMTGTSKMYVDWVKIYQKADESTNIRKPANTEIRYDRSRRLLFAGNLSGTLRIVRPDGRTALGREVIAGETIDLSHLTEGIYVVDLAGQTFKIVR